MFEFLDNAPTAKEMLTMGIQSVLILIVGYIIMKVLLRIVRRTLQKSKLDEALHTFIVNCLRIFCWIVIVITILGALDIPIATFVAILSAAGAAIALAMKDSLGNIAGGVLILVHGYLKKGDYIDDLDVKGRVESIDLFYTTLRTFDNTIITIPNGKLANNTVKNYSREPLRRVDFNFGISYNADIRKAKAILLDVANRDPGVLSEPPVYVGVEEHGESSVQIHLRAWCETENYWDVLDRIKEDAKIAFDDAGIEIPFPQITVNMAK